ncbi:MAG: DnaJ domain-containing protein [Bacillota bacterium]
MEERKRTRRRQRKQKVENYYKILGVRANASQDAIKKKYIEMVKAFPPETHPEEFQQIRRAYETLRDPARRGEYDLMRKYGGQLEKIMEEAFELLGTEQWEKAVKLLRQAVNISPDVYSIRLALARALLMQGDDQGFQEQIQLAFDRAPENEKALVLALKAGCLLDGGRAEEAFDVLEHARVTYPDHFHLLRGIYVAVYKELGREEELWNLVQSMVPPVESQNPDDVYIFIYWINTLIELEKWNLWAGVQSRMRKFLKSVKDGEDRIMVLAALQSEHDEYLSLGCFREAEIFIDFAYYIDSKNPIVQRQRRETLEMARVEREIRRMERDFNIPPLIGMKAFEWFYQDYIPPEEMELMKDEIPSFLLDDMDEAVVQGILQMKKKYPLVYRHFQDRWDAMLNEKAANLNREARRRAGYK